MSDTDDSQMAAYERALGAVFIAYYEAFHDSGEPYWAVAAHIFAAAEYVISGELPEFGSDDEQQKALVAGAAAVAGPFRDGQ